MSDNKLVGPDTLDGFVDLVDDVTCVHLGDLPPFSTLRVRTVNSLYEIVTSTGPEVYVQGGAFFPELTSAYLNGASMGGGCIRVGCICLGLRVEIRSFGRLIVTSRVLAIASVPAVELRQASACGTAQDPICAPLES